MPPEYTDPVKFVDGKPYGVSLVSTHDNIHEFGDDTENALDYLARRVVAVAGRLAESSPPNVHSRRKNRRGKLALSARSAPGATPSQ